MALSPGARLGPYEIVAALGAGGMGEVYRARDTRLGRDVAVKVLPAHLADTPEARQRLEREARAVSALNHPHICALYDVGHQDGTDYLVMEYIEGETLAARLEKGPLPLEQFLVYAVQIADALDKAHRQGVIHRDLKPGNIMLGKAGAKLLDFGLAKPVAGNASAATLATSPLARPLTAEGTIVGTFQYMSPEQLEGKEADARSDVFAFGAVLYEMVTGRKAFEGKSQASVVAAILEREPPPIASLQPMVPPALDRVVKTCLKKDPDDRWQTAHDVKLELQWIAEGGSQAGVAAPVLSQRKLRERAAWAVAALLVGIVMLAVGFFSRPAPHPQLVRAAILPPSNGGFVATLPGAGSPAVVSPDGRNVILIAAAGGTPQLWLRPLGGLSAQPMAGTAYAYGTFWSPDSRSIGFFADGKLKRIEISGGPPQTLADAPNGRGGTWNREGTILFTPNLREGIYRVSAAGGALSPVTKVDRAHEEVTHRWPQFLPDGRHFVYFIRSSLPEYSGTYVASLESGESKLLLRAESVAHYAPPGYLLFVRESSLMVQPFDAGRRETTGEAIPLGDTVQVDAAADLGLFAVSDTGVLVYPTWTFDIGHRLTWADRQGKPLGTLGSPGYPTRLELSPDGRQLAVRILELFTIKANIWVYDLARGVPMRLTTEPVNADDPVWSPDGTQIAFGTMRKGSFAICVRAANGLGEEQMLFDGGTDSGYPTSWSPDGRSILFDRFTVQGKARIWLLPYSGNHAAQPFVQTQFNATAGQFSPDGRWVAYVSKESGQDEIYVTPFPGPGARVQVSAAGGSAPRWQRDGRELFYLSSDNKLMDAQMKPAGSAIQVGAVRPLFGFPAVVGSLLHSYDVSPDGKRFIIEREFQGEVQAPVALVMNWTAELKK
jgi:Tol biopolymer transport system component/predicted Ser/Thr protein kinase